jgi:hypothetical protein
MTGTSQQFKEWGRSGVPQQRDVGTALAALSDGDLLRLRAIAARPLSPRRYVVVRPIA